MRVFKLWSSAATFAIAVGLSTLSAPAHADSYHIYDLGNANGFNIYGIDTSGAVAVFDTFAGTYGTWVDGLRVNISSMPPALAYDNGSPCSPLLAAGMTVYSGAKTDCNNGHEVYGGEYLGGSRGLYTGPDPTDFLRSGTVDALVLNSSGDFAWTDGRNEENFQAIDLSTADVPEPGSLLLLGTGILTTAATTRRRLFR